MYSIIQKFLIYNTMFKEEILELKNAQTSEKLFSNEGLVKSILQRIYWKILCRFTGSQLGDFPWRLRETLDITQDKFVQVFANPQQMIDIFSNNKPFSILQASAFTYLFFDMAYPLMALQDHYSLDFDGFESDTLISIGNTLSSKEWTHLNLIDLSEDVPNFLDTYMTMWGLAINNHYYDGGLSSSPILETIPHSRELFYAYLESPMFVNGIEKDHTFRWRSQGFELAVSLTHFYSDGLSSGIIKPLGRYTQMAFDEMTASFTTKSPLCPKVYLDTESREKAVVPDAFLTSCYYGSSIHTQENQIRDIITFEEILDYDHETYIHPKDREALLFHTFNIPIIYVCKDNQYDRILHDCQYIGHIVPLFSETQYRLLQKILLSDSFTINIDGISKTIGELSYREVVNNLEIILSTDFFYRQCGFYNLDFAINIAHQIQENFNKSPDFWDLSNFLAIQSRWEEINLNPASLNWNKDLMSLYYYLFIELGYIHYEDRELMIYMMKVLKKWAKDRITIPDTFTIPDELLL
ncbi:MAG: hypothetical protein ACTSVU_02375 [Promethearchaeota archaeon]